MSERYGMLVDKREITEARRRQQVKGQESVNVKARAEAYEKTTPRFFAYGKVFPHVLHLQQEKWYTQLPTDLATPCRKWKDELDKSPTLKDVKLLNLTGIITALRK